MARKTISKSKEPDVTFDTDAIYSPHKNPSVICLVAQSDGNWKAIGTRFGRVVYVREASPEAALGRLLIHDGK